MACDTEGRFFVLQPIVGYVSAFNSSGRRLWQRQLPSFTSLEDSVGDSPDRGKIREAMNSTASFGSQIHHGRGYLAVEVRTGGIGTRHYFYHTSGQLVGEAGPWDARIVETTEEGWRLVAGGGWDLRFYVPKVAFELQLNNTDLDSVIRHAVTWLYPRPIDRELKFNCLARPTDEIKYWLGDDYQEDYARASKAMVSHALDAQQFEELLATPTVADVVRDLNPTSTEWLDAFRKALFQEGVDTLFAEKFRAAVDRSSSESAPKAEAP
jgi:hypothetical protein